MGLIAFCAFILPWGAVALWLYLTQIKAGHTGVPWRPIARYPGFSEGPPEGRPSEPRVLTDIIPPTAGLATEPDGPRLP